MRIWLCIGLVIASMASAVIASTASAYAECDEDCVPVPVPEIDAFSGLAAMGVVGSIAALIWERRRKK
jgi:hypothetical protein